MATVSEILKTAQQRAQDTNLPYEGALLPAEAYQLMTQAANAKLVDVRTQAEWEYVGAIPGSTQIELLTYPGSKPNPNFLDELKAKVDKEAIVMFICRSGARSHNAAMVATQAGYLDCYNVLQGFEGDKDANGHRNTLGGWRAAGLPWKQG
jgi:rhodanese-related sulfurtransferase